ncbi:MAG: zinc dependent phospholipase C family protein [Deltaproteobacteria bacterium]|nr:zinc dependent phospholipase C family protein [Deltaproteobacteria bacterium]MBW1923636.1 zinc dependent phospholipase C family protein [Deltaproteobacteria bacterium]MBW1948597.1 zinc dependent phospholipase C family protein [Deltaproteobacteria bacterium]MBW2007953.1 zinc dependent phospholipase C family protein [Deltaproteobacteria bacterium]MBW2102975.1 zinc dependent phospholipase C family protein [Deltaproteobacteria bacterium]
MKRMWKWTLAAVLGAACDALFPGDARAWGPGVHTVIALGCLNELGAMAGHAARVVCAFPLEYLYGSLSADFFMGKRKACAGKRHPHTWEGGLQFYREARGDRESAYALGFLSHLAADVVAHNFYIPSLFRAYLPATRLGHLYWELRADHLVGPTYTRVAREVLDMERLDCDNLLRSLLGGNGPGLKAKRRLYTHSVRLTHYMCGIHTPPPMGDRVKDFRRFAVLMVGLSLRTAQEVLKDPLSAPPMLMDPMGRAALKRAWAFRMRQARRRAFRGVLGHLSR